METKSTDSKKSKVKSYVIIAAVIIAGLWGYSVYKNNNSSDAPAVVACDSTATDSVKSPEVIVEDSIATVIDSSKTK